MRTVHSDCRFYVGEKPCKPHKEFGVFCEGCSHYDPAAPRILIIKLGASGDVLRTTAILGSVKEMFPHSHITWICGRRSYSLIFHNPLIDRPLFLSEESLILLDHETFDLSVNFDLAPEACALSERVQARCRKGFGRTPSGAVFAYDANAEPWLEMSLWDDVKKANRSTYQAHMRRILDAPDTNHPILVPLTPEILQKSATFAAKHQLAEFHPIVGFNVGAGDRWQHKKWTVEGFAELAEHITQELQGRILILYGPADYQRAQEVMSAVRIPFVDAGLRPSMMEFIAVLNLCDVIVTGDTFALHAALGLGKRVLCLVGPTSASELELYGQGVILQGDIDCLGCYLTRCDKDPYCMKLLKAETVFSELKRQLNSR